MQLAVLIDGENVPSRQAGEILTIVRTLGGAPVLTVFGEFGGPAKSWSDAAARHAMEMHHVPAGGKGRNSTDIALTIFAMDLLRDGEVRGFCIVSSDGDFAPLAGRIRRGGCEVHGFADGRATKRYQDAFTCFHLIGADRAIKTPPRTTSLPEANVVALKPQLALSQLRAALAKVSDRDGWYHLGAFGSELRKSGFDQTQYGHARLGALMRATGAFSFKGTEWFRPNSGESVSHL